MQFCDDLAPPTFTFTHNAEMFPLGRFRPRVKTRSQSQWGTFLQALNPETSGTEPGHLVKLDMIIKSSERRAGLDRAKPD